LTARSRRTFACRTCHPDRSFLWTGKYGTDSRLEHGPVGDSCGHRPGSKKANAPQRSRLVGKSSRRKNSNSRRRPRGRASSDLQRWRPKDMTGSSVTKRYNFLPDRRKPMTKAWFIGAVNNLVRSSQSCRRPPKHAEQELGAHPPSRSSGTALLLAGGNVERGRPSPLGSAERGGVDDIDRHDVCCRVRRRLRRLGALIAQLTQ
jgi:hypothetical protein